MEIPRNINTPEEISSKNESLTSKTVHSLKWSYASTITTAILQIGYTAIMARLLDPSDFGLIAMSGVVLRFGNYFAQMGMASAVIQKKDLTKEQISAAFTSSILLGLSFTLLTFLLAPLARFVFDNLAVISLVRVMGVSFLINGFSLTALALIKRELNFKAFAVAEILAFVIGYLIVGISTALTGAGVWSLVFASLSQSIILATLTFLIVKHKVNLSFVWQDYRPLISFGSRVSVISFLEFIGGALDTILIGRFFGSSPLGIYNRAQMLINLPMQYFTVSFSRVLFPSFSQIQADNERIKRSISLILQIVSLLLFPFAIIVAILSKEIVLILLGIKWLGAVPLLKVLSFAAAINLLTHFIGVLFEAKGLLKQKILIQSVFIFFLASLFYLALGDGVLGFAVALLLSQIFKILLYFYYFFKEFNLGFLEIVKIFSIPSILSLIIYVLSLILHYILISINFPHYLVVLFIACLTILIYFIFFSLRINVVIKNKFKSLFLTFIKKTK